MAVLFEDKKYKQRPHIYMSRQPLAGRATIPPPAATTTLEVTRTSSITPNTLFHPSAGGGMGGSVGRDARRSRDL